ncbi:MAG: hypothetical protein U0795_16060 [Pirellulales bacterium]
MKIREVALDRFGVWHEFALPPLQPGVNVVYLDDSENADQLYQALTGLFFGFQPPLTIDSSQVQITLDLHHREAPFRQLRVKRRGGLEPSSGAYRERVELTELPPGDRSPVSWWQVWGRSAHRIRHFYWSANPVSTSIERRLAHSPLLPTPARKKTHPPAPSPAPSPAKPPQESQGVPTFAPSPEQQSMPVEPAGALPIAGGVPRELTADLAARHAELQQTLDQLQQLDGHHAELTRLLAELAAIGGQLAELRRLDREQLEQLKRQREARQQAQLLRQELARYDGRLALVTAAIAAWPIWRRDQRWQQLAELRAQRAGQSHPNRTPSAMLSSARDHEQHQVRWLQEHTRVAQARDELQRQLQELLTAGPQLRAETSRRADAVQLAGRSTEQLTADLQRLEGLLAEEQGLERAVRRQRADRRQERSQSQTARRDRLRRARQTLIELREPARQLKAARAAWRKWSTVEAEEAWRQTSLLTPAEADSVWESTSEPTETPAWAAASVSTAPTDASPELLSEIELLRRRIDLGVEMRGMREQLEQLEEEHQRTLANEATPEQALRLLIGILAFGLLILLAGLMMPRGSSWQLLLVVLGLVCSVASALIKISYDRTWSRRREHYDYHRQMLLTALTESSAEVDELSRRLPAGGPPLEIRLQQLLDQLETGRSAELNPPASLPLTVPLAPSQPLPKVVPVGPTPAESWERRRPQVEGDLRRAVVNWRRALRGQRLDDSLTPRRIFQLVRDAARVPDEPADSPADQPRVPTQLQTQLNAWRRAAAELTDFTVTPESPLPAWRKLLPRVRARAERIRSELEYRDRLETARRHHDQQTHQLRQQLTDLDHQAQHVLHQAGAADRRELERQLLLTQRWIRTAMRWQQSSDRCERALVSQPQGEAIRGLIQVHDRRALRQQQLEAEQARRAVADQIPTEVAEVLAPAASAQVRARMDALEVRQQQLQAQAQLIGQRLGAATEVRASLVRWAREESEARDAARQALEARLRLASSQPVAAPVAPLPVAAAQPARARRKSSDTGASRRRVEREAGRQGRPADAQRLNGIFSYFVRQMTRGSCRGVVKGRDGRLTVVRQDGRRSLVSELSPGLRRQVALGLHLGQALLVGSSSPQVPLIWRLPDAADRYWDGELARQLAELSRRTGCQVILIVSSDIAARRLGRNGLSVIDVLRETSVAQWSSSDSRPASSAESTAVPPGMFPTLSPSAVTAATGLTAAGPNAAESAGAGHLPAGSGRSEVVDPLAGAEEVEYQVAVPPERGPGVWPSDVWPASPPPPRQWLTEPPDDVAGETSPPPSGSGPLPGDWRDEPPTWFPD